MSVKYKKIHISMHKYYIYIYYLFVVIYILLHSQFNNVKIFLMGEYIYPNSSATSNKNLNALWLFIHSLYLVLCVNSFYLIFFINM